MMDTHFTAAQRAVIIDAFETSCQKITKASVDAELVAIKAKILELTGFLDSHGYKAVPMKVRIAHIVGGITEPPKCIICGNPARLKVMAKGVPDQIYSKVCSEPCNRRVGNSRKFDDKYYDLITQSPDWLRERHVVCRESIQFMAKTYGPSEPFIKKWMTHWGIEHIDYKYAQAETMRVLNDANWLRREYVDGMRSVYCIGDELNVHASTVARYIRRHGLPVTPSNMYARKHIRSSKPEIEICEYIESLVPGIDIVKSNRTVLRGKEIDILLPEYGFAIEYDGFPHHTEVFGGKDRHYHKSKTSTCADAGIKLVHITSSEWCDPTKKETWKSMIASALGVNAKVYARNCEIDMCVANNEVQQFLINNHLQGARKGDTYKIGLRLDGELVSLMCFAKSRLKQYDWELTRFCSRRNTNVVGAASRLLKAFTKTVEGSIISYADLRYSDGGLYRTLGFTEVSRGAPRYHYVKDDVMYNKQMFRRNKLAKAIPMFDPLKTERENMLANGYDLYWDCGTIGFKFEPKEKAR